MASEIYGESTEDPPKDEPPLEARKVRFYWHGFGPDSNTHGKWVVCDPDGVNAPAYMFRYDMINGGCHARTNTERDIEHSVQTQLQVQEKFRGWQVDKRQFVDVSDGF